MISRGSFSWTYSGLTFKTNLVRFSLARISRAYTKSKTSEGGTTETFSSIRSSRLSRSIMLFVLFSMKDLMVMKRRGRFVGAMYISPRPLSWLSLMMGVSVNWHLLLISSGSEDVMHRPSIPCLI